MIEEKLWEKYWDTHSDDARNDLVIRHLNLAHFFAHQEHEKSIQKIDIGEYISAAYLGLIDAIERYRPSKGKFSTIASRRIIGSIKDYLRSIDPLSRRLREFKKKCDEFVYSQANGPVSDEDVAHHLMMPISQYFKAKKFVSNPLELNPNIVDHNGKNPVDIVNHSMCLEILLELINHYQDTDRNEDILLSYQQGMTFSEIGKTHNLHASRIAQLYYEIIKNMKWQLAA